MPRRSWTRLLAVGLLGGLLGTIFALSTAARPVPDARPELSAPSPVETAGRPSARPRRPDPPPTPSAGRVAPTPRPTPAPPAPAATPKPPPTRPEDGIAWRESQPLGTPSAGQLVNGVQLPEEGRHFFTWDPVQKVTPSPAWRRNGTDDLVRMLLLVLQEYAAAHPDAPRVAVGDLSRPEGGDFGREISGGVGHASHQNGLDADLYYPRIDGSERKPDTVADVDMRLAQDLVDRFVTAGAEKVFVGPTTGLVGPPDVVQVIPNHDTHLHVRIPPGSPPP